MFDKNEDTCWNSDQVRKIKAGVKGGGGGTGGVFTMLNGQWYFLSWLKVDRLIE